MVIKKSFWEYYGLVRRFQALGFYLLICFLGKIFLRVGNEAAATPMATRTAKQSASATPRMPGHRIAAPEHPRLRSAQFRLASGRCFASRIGEGDLRKREPTLRRAEPRMFGRRSAASGHPGRSGGALLRWSGTSISVKPRRCCWRSLAFSWWQNELKTQSYLLWRFLNREFFFQEKK